MTANDSAALAPRQNERALALARAALEAAQARKAAQESAAISRQETLAAHIRNVLAGVWDVLGIDPASFLVTPEGLPLWRGAVTYGYGPVYTLPTSVEINNGSLLVTVGRCRARPAGKSTGVIAGACLPDSAVDPATLGETLHDAWAMHHQGQIESRKTRFRGVKDNLEHYRPDYDENGAALAALAAAVADLQPDDLPEPFEETLQVLKTGLADAQERAARRQELDRRYTAAARQIQQIAAAYQEEHAQWRSACAEQASRLIRDNWRPFTVYSIRYAPIAGARLSGDEYEGEPYIQTVYTLDDPSAIAKAGPGAGVRAVSSSGRTSAVIIGAFLDAAVHLQAAAPPDAAPGSFHRCVIAGGVCLYFPPDTPEQTIERILQEHPFPEPPESFVRRVRRETGAHISQYDLRHPGNWAGITPESISRRWLNLDPPADLPEDEEESDTPF